MAVDGSLLLEGVETSMQRLDLLSRRGVIARLQRRRERRARFCRNRYGTFEDSRLQISGPTVVAIRHGQCSWNKLLLKSPLTSMLCVRLL